MELTPDKKMPENRFAPGRAVATNSFALIDQSLNAMGWTLPKENSNQDARVAGHRESWGRMGMKRTRGTKPFSSVM
jgi:hypothetical protein